MILLKNGRYLSEESKFVKGDVLLENEKILSVTPAVECEKNLEIIELDSEDRILPGFMDMHTHGALGYDTMTADTEQLVRITEFLAREGTTSFFPTTITAEVDDVKTALKNVSSVSGAQYFGASIDGVHIEGPYINEKQKGCHDPGKIKLPEVGEYEAFKKIVGNLKLHMTVAPEISGAMDLIGYVLKDGNTIGIGHSNADSKCVREAVDAGVKVFTHLFNAMKGLHHREPGVAGTALVSDTYVELICDGVHVHPEIVKLIYLLKGSERIILITDAMHATGLGEGEYSFGGFNIRVVGPAARKEDGTLAGSTLTLAQAVKNMMKFTGASLEEAAKMASINPARAVGMDSVTGSIQPGKRADIVVVDSSMDIKLVFCKGKRIK